PEEQKALVKYIGWGSMPKLFDRRFDPWYEVAQYDKNPEESSSWHQRYYREEYEKNKADPWFQRYLALRELLPDEAFEAARASTINAHFTAVPVIDSIYDILSHLG